jgi:dienelactone hydrolase
MIDAPYLRPEPPPSLKDDTRDRAESDRDLYVCLVVDLRRAVDVLIAKAQVDPARIGFVGHSLGAAWGGTLSGVERRLKAFVLIAGVPDPGNISGDDWYSRQMQTVVGTDPKQLQRYAALVGPISADHFIGDAVPGSILFQFARFDQKLAKNRAEEYPKVAGPSHEVRWYPTGHFFHSEQAMQDRREWLARKLGLHRP